VETKISVRHGHLSENTQSLILGKMEKVQRLFDRLTEILVTVDLEHKESPRVDVVVHAEHKKDLKASETSTELMTAVDQVVHKLEQQVRKYKERIQTHHPRTTEAPEM